MPEKGQKAKWHFVGQSNLKTGQISEIWFEKGQPGKPAIQGRDECYWLGVKALRFWQCSGILLTLMFKTKQNSGEPVAIGSLLTQPLYEQRQIRDIKQ